MYLLVGKKLQRRKKENNYKRHMIEASREIGWHFGHSNFNFLNNVESTIRSFG